MGDLFLTMLLVQLLFYINILTICAELPDKCNVLLRLVSIQFRFLFIESWYLSFCAIQDENLLISEPTPHTTIHMCQSYFDNII